jgi:hypothetical protein
VAGSRERTALVASTPVRASGPAVALFADERSPGVPVPWERTYELAGHFSALYRGLVAGAAPHLERELGLSPAAAAAFAREALVPLSHFYLDRLLRLEMLLSRNAGEAWLVADAPPLPFPSRMERFSREAASSPTRNQLLLVRLARLWGLPAGDAGVVLEEGPAASVPFVNRNFDPSTTAEKAMRVLKTAARRLANRKGPIPVLSMSYSTGALKNEGFYSSYLVNVQGRLRPEDGAPEPARRETLAAALRAAGEPLRAFLRSVRFAALDHEAVAGDFAGFLAEAWPSSLLEGARENLERGMKVLEPFRPRPLIVGERGDLESLVLLAAARTLGMRAVCYQHGGHAGYLADVSIMLEMEEHQSDVFITWGWTRLPDYPPPPPGLRLVALPVPFLSERAKRWRRVLSRDDAGKPYDLLLLSNGYHRFTTAPGGSAQSTSDHLKAVSEMLVDLVSRASRRGLSILHKPRDASAVLSLAGMLEEMRRSGGERYRQYERQDKGMTKELLDLCRVVLWDQPGTGFQECMAAGIPTMCYWKRTYNREEPFAAGLFAELERAGVIHTDADSLLAEAERVRRMGAAAWLAEPGRRSACEAFARSYAWAEDGWARHWAAWFDSLPA